MPLAEGGIFAGYTVIRLLGSGGMGEVYLAQHPRLPRRDALKILPADVSADREFRERFNREADLAASLFHPHIVGVHDRGEFDGQLWIAMDYVEGTDAAQLVRDRYMPGSGPESPFALGSLGSHAIRPRGRCAVRPSMLGAARHHRSHICMTSWSAKLLCDCLTRLVAYAIT
jgi:serine/threonine-protein kinase